MFNKRACSKSQNTPRTEKVLKWVPQNGTRLGVNVRVKRSAWVTVERKTQTQAKYATAYSKKVQEIGKKDSRRGVTVNGFGTGDVE